MPFAKNYTLFNANLTDRVQYVYFSLPHNTVVLAENKY